MTGLGWLIGFSAVAWAGEITIESDVFPTREDAMVVFSTVQQQLGADASERARLVRRYYQGQGWRYIVLVEDVSEQRAPAIAGMAEGMTIIRPPEAEPDHAAEPAPIVSAGAEAAADEPAAAAVGTPERVRVARRDQLPAAEDLLRAAVKVHGGARGGGNYLRSVQTVRFSYERTVPVQGGTLVAHNQFFRSGDAIRLEVGIQEGEGVDSTTTLTSDQQGFVQVGNEVTERDGLRTMEMLQRFSPEAVLSIPLGLPEDVETAAAWHGLKTLRKEDSGEHGLWVVAGSVAEGELGLLEAAFDSSTGHLAWVSWAAEAGEITFTYADYRELGEGGELVVPLRTRIERDGSLIEEIRVVELELGLELAAELFATGAGD